MQKIDENLRVEDEIITMFCESCKSDLEFAMPIVKQAFKKFNVDFSAPSKEGLQNVSTHLVNTLYSFNPGGSQKLKIEYMKLINELK